MWRHKDRGPQAISPAWQKIFPFQWRNIPTLALSDSIRHTAQFIAAHIRIFTDGHTFSGVSTPREPVAASTSRHRVSHRIHSVSTHRRFGSRSYATYLNLDSPQTSIHLSLDSPYTSNSLNLDSLQISSDTVTCNLFKHCLSNTILTSGLGGGVMWRHKDRGPQAISPAWRKTFPFQWRNIPISFPHTKFSQLLVVAPRSPGTIIQPGGRSSLFNGKTFPTLFLL